MRGDSTISATRWTYSIRVIPGEIKRAQWRNTLTYRVTDDLQVGVEYNPMVDQVGPLFNWRIAREGPNQPAVMIGTSSDRIGTPYGQSYYIVFSKEVVDGLGLYAGASYSEFEDTILYPAGASFRFDDRWGGMLIYDGRNFNPLVSYSWDTCSLSVLLARMRHPGVSFSVGF